MNSTTKSWILLTVFACAILFSCNKKHTKAEIEAAMTRYDEVYQRGDADSIALLFTPNGDLSDMAHGRTWIRRIFYGSKKYRKFVQHSTSESIDIHGDSAIQKGSYYQEMIIMPEDSFRVNGTYTARWIWGKQSGWLLDSIGLYVPIQKLPLHE